MKTYLVTGVGIKVVKPVSSSIGADFISVLLGVMP